MENLYKNAKNNNFINENEIFDKYKTILKKWDKFLSLPPRLKRVLTYRYDLKNNEGNFMSYREVAKKFRVDRKTIYLLEKKAFKIMLEE